MIDFFYSDPHFGHQNVIEYCDRPWETANEMNEALIELYNKTVNEKQTVVWVGDCFFISSRESKEIMDRLNGKKILVLGNHDHKESTMYSIGFDFVCRSFDLKICKQLVTVNHFPFRHGILKRLKGHILRKTYEDRFFNRRVKNKGQWLIHGHSHSKLKQNGKQIHVGVDAWGYKPVSIYEIHKIINRGCK